MGQTTSAEIRDCRSRAAECARQAKEATDPRLRDEFLVMEQRWLRLANRHEMSRKAIK